LSPKPALALGLGAAALALAGCPGIGSKGSAREGGTIRVGVSRSLHSLDPGVATGPAAREALWLVYTPPVTYAHSDEVKLVPGVATAVPKRAAAGTLYNFTLRRGLRYSDGRAVRAGDVAYAIRRSRALSPEARRLFGGVRRMVANDRTRRVRIELQRADPDFPYALATTFAAPVPRSTPARDTTRRPPPGVGPYAFAKSVPGREFVLRRNPRFELPGLPRGYLTEISARRGGTAAQVIDGELDYVQERPPSETLPDMRSKYRDRYAEHLGLATTYLALDVSRPPFDEERVRQAVELALDKRKLAVLADGFLEPTCNLLPPAVDGYRKLDPCPWGDPQGDPDLIKARNLVERAGAGGARATVASRPGDRRLAREVVATLRKIGLGARLARRRATARLRVLVAPLPTATHLLAPLAERSHADPGLAPRAQELRVEPDRGRARKLAGDLDRELVERSAAVPIGYEKRPALLSQRMDARNCATFNPLYGNDWASFCLQ
jgi:peptide/nickel transport system substrate-binding protein